jgi:phosphonate transport system ATP-binding protein
VNIAREFGEQFIGLKGGEVVFDGSREELTTEVLEGIYGDIETGELREGTERIETDESARGSNRGLGTKP